MAASAYHARMRNIRALGLLVAALSSTWTAAQQTQSAAPVVSPEGATLNALIKEYQAERARLLGQGAAAAPAIAVDPGPKGSPEDLQKLAAAAKAFRTKLAALKTEQLTHDEWILYGIGDYTARVDAEHAPEFFWLMSIITPYSSGLQTIAKPFALAPIRTRADEDAYLAALAKLPATMKAYQARLEAQLTHGYALPTEELRLVLPMVRGLSVAPPNSPFSVNSSRLAALAPAERRTFPQSVDAAIESSINPAINALAAYIDGPYRTHTVQNVGLSQYPNGAAYYAWRIRDQTGLDLTPQQIHDTGLREIARINDELEQIRQQVGFSGALAEFKAFLRTDKRFYPKTADEIGRKMMDAIHIIEPRMPQYFSEMPKAPYGVRRLAPELEPGMTYGIYSLPDGSDPKGYYNYNGLNPETRSITMVTAIIFHELLPGHHYQLNLARENTNLTDLRKHVMYTAYTEGWGEYSSDLAGEMGGYPDPYARAGRLGMDLFTSSRLVVDTGMNALGWSRERAIQFMKENTFEGDAQIDTETLRYSVDMPAQALCYKLGALQFKEARERVKQALGSAFDIRRFHAYVLDAGEMPVGMLGQHIECLLNGELHKGHTTH